MKATAIGTGQDVSLVKHAVDGAFTAQGAKQTLVIFFAGHCGILGLHAEHYGTTFALLFENERIVASSTQGPTAAVELRALDLDHDGSSELLELTADYAGETTFAQAAVWSYRTGIAQMLATFDLAHHSCQLPAGEHYESTLLAHSEKATGALCLLARRRELSCNKGFPITKVPTSRWARPGPMPTGGDWNGVFHSELHGDLRVTVEGALARGSFGSGENVGELVGLIDGDLWRFSWTERSIADLQPRHGRGMFRYLIDRRDLSHEIRGGWGFARAEVGNAWEAIKVSK